jgi:hypothetical protein
VVNLKEIDKALVEAAELIGEAYFVGDVGGTLGISN